MAEPRAASGYVLMTMALTVSYVQYSLDSGLLHLQSTFELVFPWKLPTSGLDPSGKVNLEVKGRRPNSGVNLFPAFRITLPYCIQGYLAHKKPPHPSTLQ